MSARWFASWICTRYRLEEPSAPLPCHGTHRRVMPCSHRSFGAFQVAPLPALVQDAYRGYIAMLAVADDCRKMGIGKRSHFAIGPACLCGARRWLDDRLCLCCCEGTTLVRLSVDAMMRQSCEEVPEQLYTMPQGMPCSTALAYHGRPHGIAHRNLRQPAGSQPKPSALARLCAGRAGDRGLQ